ncbi:7082_t:CDS:1, partial [Gigaspora rosea]
KSSEIITKLSENNNNTENDISRFINDAKTETSNSFSIPQSFLNNFDRMTNVLTDMKIKYQPKLCPETI